MSLTSQEYITPAQFFQFLDQFEEQDGPGEQKQQKQEEGERLTRSGEVVHHPGPRKCSRIPPELWDEIIGHLSEDLQTLKACSQASKQWLDRSRRHLFRSVALPGLQNANPHRGLITFLAFLLADTDQRRHIQNLRIFTKDSETEDPLEDPRRASVCKHDLQEVLLQLPNLRKLTLSRIRFRGCRTQCAMRSLKAIPISLKILTLEAGSWNDQIPNLFDIFSLFGDVDVLNALAIRFEAHGSDTTDDLLLSPVSPAPEHLRIRTVITEREENFYDEKVEGVFWKILQNSPSVRAVTGLRAYCGLGAAHPSLKQFMQNIKGTLVQLYLDLTGVLQDLEFDQEPIEWGWLALSSYPCMQSVAFALTLTNDALFGTYIPEPDEIIGEMFGESIRLINILFTASRSKSIRHVTVEVSFVLYYEREPDIGTVLASRVDWQTFREVLGRLDNLETLTFVVGGRVIDVCRPVLERVWEDLHARGVLRLKGVASGYGPPRLQIEE
ncbi:hypothetical protein EIP91_002542 [Steccherinum ochraceum]|uniref:F-box domain-containing protein n=1 Tax=Steccherinum ochraceum TaxID=92696 RepID=A0A4R0RFN0_9APHY|nr:hypothetical protein EIP91_002542 [Steccherinum ochraceum]